MAEQLSTDQQFEALAAYATVIQDGLMDWPEWGHAYRCRLFYDGRDWIRQDRWRIDQPFYSEQINSAHIALCLLECTAIERLHELGFATVGFIGRGELWLVDRCSGDHLQQKAAFDLGNIHLNLIAALELTWSWHPATIASRDKEIERLTDEIRLLY